jgi:hypothetical protein
MVVPAGICRAGGSGPDGRRLAVASHVGVWRGAVLGGADNSVASTGLGGIADPLMFGVVAGTALHALTSAANAASSTVAIASLIGTP